jgi:hypothetical protein
MDVGFWAYFLGARRSGSVGTRDESPRGGEGYDSTGPARLPKWYGGQVATRQMGTGGRQYFSPQ